MSTNIAELVEQMTPAQRTRFLEQINTPPKKKKTHVSFRPVDQVKIDNIPRVCITKKDAIRNLGEVMLVDIDKMSVAEIKGRAVGLLAYLAETEEEGDRKKTLAMAARIVLEESRDKLMYKVASLAAWEGGR